ncbi:MAG: hypothetical protein PSN34_03995 [Urechidicola sp.]|nr:hypothetical protein [Urechidicola sp.]
MSIQTIEDLRNNRDEIKKNIRLIKTSDYGDTTYGSENEYVAKSLIASVESILIDITTLTKSPAKFIQKSNYQERNNLITHVRNIDAYIRNTDLSSLSSELENTKPLLRNFGLRYSNERIEVFNDYINNLQKEAFSLKEEMQEILEIKKSSDILKNDILKSKDEITEKIGNLEEKKVVFDELIEETKRNRDEVENLLDIDNKRSEQIQDLLSHSETHNEAIDNFSKKVSERENQLEDQKTKTDEYEQQLISFSEDHQAYLKDAKKLIDDAKDALEYTTASGISAAFSEKYNESKKDGSAKLWVRGAAAFIVTAIGIGIWIVWENEASTQVIIGRISLLPILIAGAWFCAGQYVKQRDIAEDYAYKSVLAKSIVGFSDQFSSSSNKGEEYSHYIKSVLEQIHNDPLRKHTSKEIPIKEVRNSKSILDEIQGIKKLIGKNKPPTEG